jgi:hypothetical protein
MTAMSAHHSTGEVIRAVTEGEASSGVLPAPQEGEPDPWWPHLLSADKNAPRVIARLPFGARGNARSDGALVIGRGEQQDTGRDRTLLATECAAAIDRGRIVGLLASVGLVNTFFTSYGHAATMLSLIEVQGCVRVSDPPFDGFRAELGTALRRLLPVGGYAVPLTAAELAAKG